MYCLLRKEYLYDLKKGHGEFEECYLMAFVSIPSWAPMFSILTKRGVMFTHIPISGICHKEVKPQRIDELSLWNSFSVNFSITQYQMVKNCRVQCFLKNTKPDWGTYLWTIDWYGDTDNDTTQAEDPTGHKQGHFIKLDNGNFAMLPGNRMYWSNPDFVTNPFKDGERPDYITNSQLWSCEFGPRWYTSDDDLFFYGVTEE
jgi:hypothetical protein